MKIIILGPAHPLRGGIAASSERLAIQLQNEGHEVEMKSFSLQYPSILFPGKSQYTDSPAPKNLKIEAIVNSINPFNWLMAGLKLKKLEADLIIARFWLPFLGPSVGSVCKIARWNKKTKVITIVDNLLPHEKRIGDVAFTRYFVNQNDGLIAMSNSVFDDLDLFRKDKPKAFAPHPIYDHYGEIIPKEEAKTKLKLDTNFKYVLFFGFIRDYKGLDLLLKAFANDKLYSSNIKLIVAGEFYSNQEKYRSMIEELKLQEKVHIFSEYIPDHEINQYFCAADLITQPYKTATQSGVTQVGYHFNKPMLVTNVGGLPEIIEHNKCGYVVNPEPTEIANSILDFYENERENEMIVQVKKIKDKFSWKRLTEAIFDIYKQFS